MAKQNRHSSFSHLSRSHSYEAADQGSRTQEANEIIRVRVSLGLYEKWMGGVEAVG